MINPDITETIAERHLALPAGVPMLITRDEFEQLIVYINSAYGTKATDEQLPNGCCGLFMGRELFIKYEPMEVTAC